MGVDVILARVEQRGSSPKRRRVTQADAVLDNKDRFARLCASSALPMLSRVDPYGTLVLTPQEMDQFISEIETGLAQVEDPEVAELLKDVLRLARTCADQPMTEVHLEGD